MSRLTPGQLLWITAEETHALIGAFLVYLCSVYSPHNHNVLGAALFGLLVLEIFKEYWWDLHNETGETVLTGTVDLLFYYVGAGIALLALFLTHRPL